MGIPTIVRGGVGVEDVALTNAQILVGNASGAAADVAVSGDATLANTGALTVTDVTVGSDAAGDMLYKSSATALARLAKGTAGQVLLMNAGATAPSWASMGTDATIAATGALTIAADAIVESKVGDSSGGATGGLFIAKYVQVQYSFAVHGGTAGAISLSNGPTVPDNAVVQLLNYDVITAATSAASTATIKIGLATDGDLSTAIAINDGSSPWSLAPHLGSAVTPIIVKTTAARQFVLTIGVQDTTAGVINFNFLYWISG